MNSSNYRGGTAIGGAPTNIVLLEFFTRWLIWAAIDLCGITLLASVQKHDSLARETAWPILVMTIGALSLYYVVRRPSLAMLTLGLRYRIWIVAVLAWFLLASPRWYLAWGAVALPQAADCIVGAWLTIRQRQ